MEAARQIEALVALSRDARASKRCAQHAELLARALALVSRRHAISAPVRSQGATVAALAELALAIEQHAEAVAASPSEPPLSPAQQALLETGVVTLWSNVALYGHLIALADLILAVDFIPRALRFWKAQRRQPWRATIQSGPFEWVKPEALRITIDERIYSLESTLNAFLEKLGSLKAVGTRLWNAEPTDVDTLHALIREGFRLLEDAYSSSGIVPPRRGKGAFKTLDPLNYTFIKLDYACEAVDAEAKRVTDASLAHSLAKLRSNLARLAASREQFAQCFAPAMAPCRVPSRVRQRWLHWTVAGAAVVSAGVWVVRNQREFHEAVVQTRTAAHEFLTEHMIEPVQAIVGELLLHETAEIADASALQDSKDSLRRMLGAFAKEKNPSLSLHELERVMRDMDMSVVSLQYEKEIGSAVRNLMSGDIVRMLLIQVQFIKKELMVAMGAIDELMRANQLNLQMLATIPTFLLFGGVYALAKELFRHVYKRTSERLYHDPGEVAGVFRSILRDVERLLNKQNRPVQNVLEVRDLGLLLLLLHQLRDVFDGSKALFDEDEQQRFDEDLNDLIQDGLLVSQQLAVIQRMYHSHPFLHRTKTPRGLFS